MALPGSGQLRFSAIASELGVSLSNVSLRNMSSSAGFSTPDRVGDFYGYGNCPAYGTFLYSSCDGCEEIYHYADGGCGEYTQVVNYNSPNCGCGGGLTLFFVSNLSTNLWEKVCQMEPSCCTPVWHTGSGPFPQPGDFVYTDGGGTTALRGFKGQMYYGMDSVECNTAFQWLLIDDLGSGQVFETGECFLK